MMNTSEYIIKYLEAIGIKKLFGVGGANIEDIYHAAAEHGTTLNAILAKHEFGAYCMAQAYSHLTHGLGVVMTTSGAGAMNIVPGLAESFGSDSPVLALIGQPPGNLHGKGAFQDESGLNNTINGDALFRLLEHNYFFHIKDPNEVPEHLFRAVSSSLSEVTGPSILLINKDVQAGFIAEDNPYFFQLPEVESFLLDESFESILALIQNMIDEGPSPFKITIVIGSEIVRTNMESLVYQLAVLLNAAIICTPSTKTLIKKNDPRFKGLIGIASHDAAIHAFEEADLVMIIGSRLSVLTTVGIDYLIPIKKTLYINNQKPFFPLFRGKTGIVVGSVPRALKKMLGYFSQQPSSSDWPTNVLPQVKEPVFFHPDKKTEFNFKNIFSIFSRCIEENSQIYFDAGNTGGAALHYLALPPGCTCEIALGMGGMGYAICAGIGGALTTHKRTYIFAGDGAALMSGMEMHTALEYQLPVVLVVINNGGHGMCKTREKLFFNTEYNFDLFQHHVDFAKGLSALFPGIIGFQIHSLNDLEAALSEIKTIAGPVCLDIQSDPDEVPPFLPFLNKLTG